MATDRAARTATAVLSIVADALHRWLPESAAASSALAEARASVETYLRDELHDFEWQIRGDRKLAD
jgi:hypothetical protein